jgi:hypothetical protein
MPSPVVYLRISAAMMLSGGSTYQGITHACSLAFLVGHARITDPRVGNHRMPQATIAYMQEAESAPKPDAPLGKCCAECCNGCADSASCRQSDESTARNVLPLPVADLDSLDAECRTECQDGGPVAALDGSA